MPQVQSCLPDCLSLASLVDGVLCGLALAQLRAVIEIANAANTATTEIAAIVMRLLSMDHAPLLLNPSGRRPCISHNAIRGRKGSKRHSPAVCLENKHAGRGLFDQLGDN